jgi:hypothetical protein
MIKRPTSSLYKEEKVGRRGRRFFYFTHCPSFPYWDQRSQH